MYRWIWQKLPFGLPGKVAGSVLLGLATMALLWFVVFPWADELMPFGDVQVTQDGGTPVDGPAGVGPVPGPQSTRPGAGHDLPYDTSTNNPHPTSRASAKPTRTKTR